MCEKRRENELRIQLIEEYCCEAHAVKVIKAMKTLTMNEWIWIFASNSKPIQEEPKKKPWRFVVQIFFISFLISLVLFFVYSSSRLALIQQAIRSKLQLGLWTAHYSSILPLRMYMLKKLFIQK